VKWVYHDEDDREEYFIDLLQKVKLHDLSTKFLEEVVFEEVCRIFLTFGEVCNHRGTRPFIKI